MLEDEITLLLTASEAARLIGISRAKFYAMHSSGRLGPLPVSFGKSCTRWIRTELESWVEARCPSRDIWLDNNGQTKK